MAAPSSTESAHTTVRIPTSLARAMVAASSCTVRGFSAWFKNVAFTPAAASASGRMWPMPRPGTRLSMAWAQGIR